MKNVKLTIEYNGRGYVGWQRQPNGVAVEEVVDNAIKKFLSEDIKLYGSSRTDAGVHARGQVANFRTCSDIPAERYQGALNGLLPDDVVILKSEEVPLEFHSRYDSKGKAYSYSILNRKTRPAFMNEYLAFVPYELDFQKMQHACKDLLGTHDFAAFKSKGGSVKTSVRTIHSIELIKNGDLLTLQLDGNSFLYNMVRIIAGTLVDIGRGRFSADAIPEILASLDRNKAGKTAPAAGLCLERIYY